MNKQDSDESLASICEVEKVLKEQQQASREFVFKHYRCKK